MSERDDLALEPQMTMRFPPLLYEALARYAATAGFTKQEAALEAVRLLVADQLTAEATAQIKAEASIMAAVQSIAEDLRRTDNWDEDVVLDVFKIIEGKEALLRAYGMAVGGDPFEHSSPDKIRINRNIAKRIKVTLAAEDLRTTAGVVRGASLASRSLVRSYTKLARRSAAPIRPYTRPLRAR